MTARWPASTAQKEATTECPWLAIFSPIAIAYITRNRRTIVQGGLARGTDEGHRNAELAQALQRLCQPSHGV